MCHCGAGPHLKEFFKKFKVSKENKGDKLLITLAGAKEDVAKLDKKIDVFHILAEGCCEGGDKDCC